MPIDGCLVFRRPIWNESDAHRASDRNNFQLLPSFPSRVVAVFVAADVLLGMFISTEGQYALQQFAKSGNFQTNFQCFHCTALIFELRNLG